MNTFIYGVQYYRAPTPHKENWDNDLKNIKKMGFSDVKFWVQWRWAHREENTFYFDDIDCLMDMAYKYGLRVTLNVIFDVAPLWITKKYEDAKIVLANGRVVEQCAMGHRQIGGFPGVCYSHKEALTQRNRFLEKTVERYRTHPALFMWDLWNEPEQCGTYRYPRLETLSCYCDNCRNDFILWLENKYKTVENLNDVWGRCYSSFDEAELPKKNFTFADFIDYRLFSLDKMTKEAQQRITVVKKADKSHPVYLHVVPNTSSVFNSLTGVDDFSLAKECDVFASTNFAKPVWSVMTTSASNGKICYNTECHIGGGSIKMHPKMVTLRDLARDLIPQIGMGLKGFMFWQYRAEILGHEAPAWGVTKPDGTPGSVGKASETFISRLNPYIDAIMNYAPKNPEIAIRKSTTNEILSFCINGNLESFSKSIEEYINAVYYSNYNCCVVNDERIKEGLSDVKLLILPTPYGMDYETAAAIDKFVNEGGVVLSEAHLGGYNENTGRHSYNMPGHNLFEKWGIEEEYTTSSYHLKNISQEKLDTSSMVDDVKKVADSYGINGGKNFKVATILGIDISCSERYASLNGGETIGTFFDDALIVKKSVGKGMVIYCGTNLGEAAENDMDSFVRFVKYVIELSGVSDNGFINKYGVHVDKISENLVAINNSTKEDIVITSQENLIPVFEKNEKNNIIKSEGADLYIIEQNSLKTTGNGSKFYAREKP